MTFSTLQLFLLIVLLRSLPCFLLLRAAPSMVPLCGSMQKNGRTVTDRIVDTGFRRFDRRTIAPIPPGGRAQAVLYSYSVDGKNTKEITSVSTAEYTGGNPRTYEQSRRKCTKSAKK